MRKTLLLLLTMLIGLGVVPAKSQAPKVSLSAPVAVMGSIGVISAIGDQINIYTDGPSLFGLIVKYHPLSGTSIDDALVSFVDGKIGASFKVIPVQYDRAKFSMASEAGFAHPATPPPIAELIKTLTAPVDAYLVISKSAVPFGLRTDTLRAGLNMGRNGSIFVMHAFVNVSLFDARTHKLLARSIYPAPISRFWGGTVESLPLDVSLWPDRAGNLTPSQDSALKDLLTADLVKIIGKEIDKLGILTPPSGTP